MAMARSRPAARGRLLRPSAPAADQRGWQTFSTVVHGPGITETCTCEQAGCDKFRNGWRVALDESIPIAAHRARYLRTVSRRRHVETREAETVAVFTFEPGVPCFSDHRDARGRAVFEAVFHRRQVRDTLHLVSAGHSVAVGEQINATGRPDRIVRTHTRPQDWAEHAAESWNRMAQAINR
jgi:hypothetical protein